MIFKSIKWVVFVACLIFVSSAVSENIAFSDATEEAGVAHSGDSWGVAWGDFNNDGWPDLYDGNHRERPAFFINQGDGTFLNSFNTIFAHNNIQDFIDTHGAQWADLDNDGYSDLVVQVGGNGGGATGAWANSQVLMNRNGRLDQRAEELGLAKPEFRGRTPLMFDYDRDGLLDILFTNMAPGGGARLYHQMSDMEFQDVTGAVGLPIDTDERVLYAVITDLEADGTEELLYSKNGSPIFSYMPSSFMDVSALYGQLDVNLFDMAIGDIDGDLRPDIFRGGNLFGRTILEQPQPNTLAFRYLWPTNTATFEVGFTFRTKGPVMFEMDGGWVSVNDYLIGADGWTPPVIETINGPMIVNLDPSDSANQGVYSYNFTDNTGNVVIGYEPELDEWKVVFIHEERGPGQEKPTLSGKIVSEDQITILSQIGTYEPQYTIPSKLFLNMPSGFLRLGSGVGIDQDIAGGVHVVSADFDNDGDLDIYSSNSSPLSNTPDFIYENDGGVFLKQLVGVDSLQGNGSNVAVADYDLDGYLDVYVTHGADNFPFNTGPHQLLKNTGSGNNWLQIDLEGITSNRDGLGARVRLKAGGVTQERYQNGGMHKYGQNMQRLHFGLGASKRADLIEVYWPSGIVQRINRIAANQIIRVQETPAEPVSPKGQPDIYQAPGVFLWKKYYDGPYHVRVHGITENQLYKVNVISDQNVSDVVLVDAESSDVLNLSSRGFEFLATTAQWVDGVDFNVTPGARTMMSVEGPTGTNPRLLFVGEEGQHLPPAGWILAKVDLPKFEGYARGEQQGLSFGAVAADSMEYKLRWTSQEFIHRYSLWLAAAEPGLAFDGAKFLEVDDQLSSTENAVLIDGRIAAPWEDGLNLTSVPGDKVALSFSMDGLFQRHFVNLFQQNGTQFPNAYWLTAPSPVGEPSSEVGLPLAKVWKEGERGRWHIKFTAGGGKHVSYIGEINSTGTLSLVDDSSLEPEWGDAVDTSVAGSLTFNARVVGNWHDEIVFDAGDEDTLTFTLDGSGGLQHVRIGQAGWPVQTLPVTLQ